MADDRHFRDRLSAHKGAVRDGRARIEAALAELPDRPADNGAHERRKDRKRKGQAVANAADG